MPTHETEGAGRGLSEAERRRLDNPRVAAGYWRSRAEQAEAERDHWRKRAERRLATVDQLKAENDRLRAQVAACEALAEEWEQDYPSDLAACSYAADTWWRALRDALSDPAVVLAQVRAEALREAAEECSKTPSSHRHGNTMHAFGAWLRDRADRIEGA